MAAPAEASMPTFKLVLGACALPCEAVAALSGRGVVGPAKLTSCSPSPSPSLDRVHALYLLDLHLAPRCARPPLLPLAASPCIAPSTSFNRAALPRRMQSATVARARRPLSSVCVTASVRCLLVRTLTWPVDPLSQHLTVSRDDADPRMVALCARDKNRGN